MSHLGDLLSAHVDGQLDGAQRDKVSTHLARCEHCREEASALRALKRQLGRLAAEAPAEAGMAQRMLEIAELAAIAGPTGAVKTRPVKMGRRVVSRHPGSRSAPGGSRRPRLTRRRRYLLLGTVSIVVGLGTTAFSVGGGDPAPGPRIVPQVELYSEEHAITTGGVPFDGPGPEMGPMAGTVSAQSEP
jgi:anti-sigma factor RsiW